MKRSSKVLALLLALAMVLSFAACAKTETPAQTTASEQTAQEPAAQETAAQETPAESAAPAAEAPAEAQPSEPAAQDASVEIDHSQHLTVDVPEGTYENGKFISPHGVEYPASDEVRTVTRWMEFAQQYDEITTYNELFSLPTILENTNIQYEFVEAPIMSASEQYQLMIAAESYPDVIPVGYYTGGANQAYTDEVIVAITDIVETAAPDYWSYISQESEEHLRASMNDGEWLGMYNYIINRITEAGNQYRADWLEKLGIDPSEMETLDGFVDVLYAVYNEYHPARTYYMEESGTWFDGQIIWDTPMANISRGGGVNQYVIDGNILSGFISDGYREYLEFFYDLYKDGIFGMEFYNGVSSRNEVFEGCANGDIFFYNNNASGMDDPLMFVNEDNQDCEWKGTGYIYKDETHTNLWGSEPNNMESASGNQPTLYITSNCADPSLVLYFINYFFTQPGYMIANYGVEGLSYNLDENGVPIYTEKVTANSDLPTTAMRELYGMMYIPFLNNMSALNGTYSDKMLQALQLWTEQVAAAEDTGRNYPSGAALTTDETSSIVNIQTDIATYAQEQILKFMTGAAELNDANWDAYVNQCYALGLQTALDVYQNAYNQWAAGER